MQNRKEQERDDERHRMNDDRCVRTGKIGDLQRCEDRGQRGFPEGAKPQARQGDPHLHAGNDAIQLAD